MDWIKEYLVTVTASALIAGIATRLLHRGTVGTVVKLLAGVFLAFSVVSPLVGIRLDALSDFASDIQVDADAAADEGKKSAQEAMAEIISQHTGAYILDKAETLGVSLRVEVTVSQEEYPVPSAVRLEGSVSPYAKSVLTEYISETLGIDTEEQTWIS